MARRPTVGTAQPPATTHATHTTQHAHVMHAATHATAASKVTSPKAHKAHKASSSMTDSLRGIVNRDAWRNRGRASGQR
jgi:hypothetical protein